MPENLHTDTNRQAVRRFLERQDLAYYQLDPEQLLADYLDEMQKGLGGNPSSLPMIPTYVSADKNFLRNKAVVALDAGGTNLRCALITLPDSGDPVREHFYKRELPALKKELSAQDFFLEVARFMAPVLEKYHHRYGESPECLGFCFSYSTKISMADNGDLDGKLTQWSKEVKVPELVGTYIGSGLLQVLAEQFGAKSPKHICIINDTVATLLAGRSVASDADYTDFIGYILGTGINSCYAEPSQSIQDLDPRYRDLRAIINMEAGNYTRFPRSAVDREYDALTQKPGTYLQEKACSGRYWGELLCIVLRNACKQGILPEALVELPLQSSMSMNAVLHHPSRPKRSGLKNPPPLSPFIAWLDEHDIDCNARERIYFLTAALLQRSALFTAINMAACILRSAGGHSPLHPICLTIDGSTYYALHRFDYYVRSWLDFLLSEEKQRKRYYRIKTVENAPLLGAAIAALGFGCE